MKFIIILHYIGLILICRVLKNEYYSVYNYLIAETKYKLSVSLLFITECDIIHLDMYFTEENVSSRQDEWCV